MDDISLTAPATVTITASDASGTVSVARNIVAAPTGSPRIVAPLTGTVSAGTWASKTLSSGPSLPSGQLMRYDYLLPAGYSTNFIYPIMVWEHPMSEGNDWYSGANRSQYLPTFGPDGWFNTVAFRTAYPCIVVLPYCDQTGDGSGALQNFGGWVPPGDLGPNLASVALVVQEVQAAFSTDPTRCYITGYSLGGIGCFEAMRRYNRTNGDLGKVFSAGLPMSGVLEVNGYGSGPNSTDIAVMRNVPVFAISGVGDTQSIPSHWPEPMWTAYAGTTTYPSQTTNGGQAGTSSYWYMEVTGLSNPHDPTAYFAMPAGTPFYNWLFGQIN